jgi:hypothetical protein
MISGFAAKIHFFKKPAGSIVNFQRQGENLTQLKLTFSTDSEVRQDTTYQENAHTFLKLLEY